jgi:hypothetical protein
MNKKKAQDIIWDGGISALELRNILESGFKKCSPEKISSLNKGMTKQQAYEIFDGMLQGVDDSHIYKPEYNVYKNRNTLSGAMGAINLLREFG